MLGKNFKTQEIKDEKEKERRSFLLLSQYAQETQHEKILRGLAVGIAFTMYGRLEEADPLVTSLCADKDPILRRSGMYTLAMAYCGTGNNQAIRKLLHVAVSDVNDDVRRAAVTGLGFLLFRHTNLSKAQR
ncbi:26s proteasome non-atpase regulatory subunit 1-like isoform 2 protein [Lasius niger]|uniref:26s proteasome non-atpase regulatory subunit 1-like isoform 2 protein n=1 Tax=Lasius niger TaxID=67767 RepID=A0A0J7NEV0_LASNI|nr:26s proteasome non-atpase regulatory subunit 1-like isoform 2 protein [Lasius niger]